MTLSSELDYQLLDKEMDICRTSVFMNKNAGFLGPLLCSLNFMWTEDIKTACTNGISLQWNPHWFLKLPRETRRTVLLHEIWHVALLHMLRRGERNPRIWNWACDIFINNMLYSEGYTFDNTHPFIDDCINRWKAPGAPPLGNYGQIAVEEIYDMLTINLIDEDAFEFVWGHEDPEDGEGDETDIIEPSEEDEAGIEHRIINKVVQATTSAKVAGMGGPGGGVPGEVETMLKRFLQPKLPWETLLFQFFNDMFGQDFSWAMPDRRFQDVYLPALVDDDGALEHLIYYLDVSGSVSDAEVIRFNSEVKYIKDQFNPQRLTLVLFDDRIQREYEFYEEDRFEEVVIVGRGGTDLGPVREHIIKHKPNAAIVFSDLLCAPMEVLPKEVNVPVIFVGVNAHHEVHVNFGKLIHIKE